MKTFTLEELDRKPKAVLDACDHDGSIRIRRRDGRTYTMRSDASFDGVMNVPDIRTRLAQIFPKPISITQTRLVDKLIAGE